MWRGLNVDGRGQSGRTASDRNGRRRDRTYDDINRLIEETWIASNGTTVDNGS